MRIAVGADAPDPPVRVVVRLLLEAGHELILHGDAAQEHLDFVDVAHHVALDVACGRAVEGVVLCWTGTGVSIVANKVPGVRAALCIDAETARGARRWNHANVLALSMRTTSEPLAAEIVNAWLAEPPGSSAEDLRNVSRISDLEGPPS